MNLAPSSSTPPSVTPFDLITRPPTPGSKKGSGEQESQRLEDE